MLLYPTLAILGLLPNALAFSDSPIVTGESGLSYVGLRNSTSRQDYFLGIPFAQPPVGPLRFKPPVPWSRSDTRTVNATQNGYTCIQSARFTDDTMSEDCLTLNIWKPSKTNKKLPVMVWIYGGAFYAGGVSSFPGNYLVERAIKIGKPVVYVAMNYRIGLYGFPPGQAAEDAGASNLGLKDQRLALEWIQNNVAYFGGDPEKVIIFGESAGAVSAGCQTLYRGGNIGGAFRGMILESGSPSRQAHAHTLANNLTTPILIYSITYSVRVLKPNDPGKEEAFRLIANVTSCDAKASNAFECIRKAPSEALIKANDDLMKFDPYYQAPGQFPTIFGPTRAPGDDFFTDTPSKLLHAGKFAKVPFINGAQLDEGTIFVNGTSLNSDQDIINWATARHTGLYTSITNETAVRELLKYYPADPAAGSPYNTGNETFGQGAEFKRYASIFGDLFFQAPRRYHLRMAAIHEVKSWTYMFAERPLDFVPQFGAKHSGDIPFALQFVRVVNPNASAELLDLAQAMGDYWINFAYNLDPNVRSEPKRPSWPAYGRAEAGLQFLASNTTTFKDSARAQAIDFILSNPSLRD